MSQPAGNLANHIRAGTLCIALGLSVPALAADGAPPTFTPDPSAGWFAYTRVFIPPPSGPGPVRLDPKYPRVTNDDYRATGAQPTPAVGDANNPILQPWAAASVRKRNEAVLAGKPAFSLHAACYPVGIPHFLLEPMTRPMYIVQGPREVVMILTSFNDVRRIYLSDKHLENARPSWYGDSIGHYEGDTLVVDTIGMNDRTVVDGFDTPHTAQLHVVERWRLTEGGQILEANVHVEDPGTFTMPWDAIQRYRTYDLAIAKKNVTSVAMLATPEKGPLQEAICPDNPDSFKGRGDHAPMPKAVVPDF
jgi:hypothetical protein